MTSMSYWLGEIIHGSNLLPISQWCYHTTKSTEANRADLLGYGFFSLDLVNLKMSLSAELYALKAHI